MKNFGLLAQEAQLASLLAGLQSKLPVTGTYTVAGVTRSRDELAKVVEGFLVLFKSTREARAAVRQLAHERDLRVPELRILLQEIRSLLNTQFGMESPELLGFGFTPKGRRAANRPAKPDEQKPAA